jgi:integrase
MHPHRTQQPIPFALELSNRPNRGGGSDGQLRDPTARQYARGRKFRTVVANLLAGRKANTQFGGRGSSTGTPLFIEIALRDAWAEWLELAQAGAIRTRSGDPYKPSALRSYDLGMQARVLPVLGATAVPILALHEVQDLADRLVLEGHDASTIRNTFMGLRAFYRRAVARGDAAVNPTAGLQLPAVRGKRDRIASVREADELLAVLPESDRALWATAFFAGLRRGELMALEVAHAFDGNGVANVILVERSYDPVARKYLIPKSHAGTRRVPVTQELRGYLAAHRLQIERTSGLLFGRTATRPFDDRTLKLRADEAWSLAGLTPITLHEARHTYASLLIAAGVNSKAVSSYMGHASIAITLDYYGHLMPGTEAETASLLDAYIGRERAALGSRQAGSGDC